VRRSPPGRSCASAQHRRNLCRGGSRCRHRRHPNFGRRAVAVSRSTHRRPDKRVGSTQSAVVLPRSAVMIQSCCRIQHAFGISRMSDHSRDAPAEQLLLMAPPSGPPSSTSTPRCTVVQCIFGGTRLSGLDAFGGSRNEPGSRGYASVSRFSRSAHLGGPWAAGTAGRPLAPAAAGHHAPGPQRAIHSLCATSPIRGW
jgi:hypothetical protein